VAHSTQGGDAAGEIDMTGYRDNCIMLDVTNDQKMPKPPERKSPPFSTAWEKH
jgi:hypothetical protein